MTSLLVHALLGLITVVVFFIFNNYLYRSNWEGARVSVLEALYYILGIGSV